VTQVLARKWRPRNFTELVGQEHVVRALSNALREQRLHHAYLFTGTRGVGKTTLARIIAKALNCEQGVTDTPCGRCHACTEIEAGRFVDLLELDAASNTHVDNMRELLDNALYAPTAGRYKVYIIDEAHMLSRNAFNAMLKTLEEPPEHVKFVLATTDQQKIPVTVLSRCLQFNLKQIPPAQIQEQLAKILQAEGIAFEPAALALIARAAQGSLRDGLSLLDQAIAYGAGTVALDSTGAMLGAVDQTYLHAILRALAAGDGVQLILEADRMGERSLSFEMALQDLGTLLHRLALLQVVPQAASEDDPQTPTLRELATLFSPDELQLYYQIAVQARSEIGLAPDEYAGFTMALLRMLAFAPSKEAAGVRPHAPESSRASQVAPTAAASAAAPLSSAAPAPPTEAPRKADGTTWAGMIEKLGLVAVPRVLAENCELVTLDAERIELRLPKAAYERYKSGEERLKAALRKHLGPALQIKISVGPSNGDSPADIAGRERDRQQAKAVAEIEQDPFVRDLVENFGARVNENSIKPIQ
jgi:DNA polymerase-3 subunit gamma/tau